jgi:excisionase family DNA binding protein
MAEEQTMATDFVAQTSTNKTSAKIKLNSGSPQFLSTAEAARMLGLSTTLVQTLVDQGDLKGWKTRGGHRRISLDSIFDYQNASRYVVGTSHKQSSQPRVSVVIESATLFEGLRQECHVWKMPVEVNFFGSVTEALLDLSSNRPDMIVVELSMPREQQQKTFQALENFNQRGHAPLSVVLITTEKELTSVVPTGSSSSIQVVSGQLTAVWLHAYLTGILATYRL